MCCFLPLAFCPFEYTWYGLLKAKRPWLEIVRATVGVSVWVLPPASIKLLHDILGKIYPPIVYERGCKKQSAAVEKNHPVPFSLMGIISQGTLPSLFVSLFLRCWNHNWNHNLQRVARETHPANKYLWNYLFCVIVHWNGKIRHASGFLINNIISLSLSLLHFDVWCFYPI